MEMFEESEEASTPADALAFLRSVYQCRTIPLPVRMRAAQMALPFEKPALRATASIIVGEDFAQRLEKAIERAQARKVLEPPALDV
jgi:hypothetical protein